MTHTNNDLTADEKNPSPMITPVTPTTPSSLFSFTANSHSRSVTFPFIIPNLSSSFNNNNINNATSPKSSVTTTPLSKTHPDGYPPESGWNSYGDWMDGRESPTPLPKNQAHSFSAGLPMMTVSAPPHSSTTTTSSSAALSSSLKPSQQSSSNVATSLPHLSSSSSSTPLLSTSSPAKTSSTTPTSFFGKKSLLSGRLHHNHGSNSSSSSSSSSSSIHDPFQGNINNNNNTMDWNDGNSGSGMDRLSVLKESHNDPGRPITPLGNMILTGQFLM